MSEKEGRQASSSAAFPELGVGYESRAECACPDGDEASNDDRPEWSVPHLGYVPTDKHAVEPAWWATRRRGVGKMMTVLLKRGTATWR